MPEADEVDASATARESDALFQMERAALAARLDALPRASLDALPFGVIRTDATGAVVYFSATEAQQSGYQGDRALGRTFFTEMAPCMGTPAFLQRIERAASAGTLDVTFEHVGDFQDAERELTARVFSAASPGLWIFLRRRP
jgi:photoactive yellow protein